MTASPNRTETELAAVIRVAITSVAPNADLSDLGLDDDLVERLELDSMDVLNVMTAVADQTGIEVPERDYPRTRTLQGFVEELQRLGAGG